METKGCCGRGRGRRIGKTLANKEEEDKEGSMKNHDEGSSSESGLRARAANFAASEKTNEVPSEQEEPTKSGSIVLLPVPQTKIEAAHEFRMDSVPSTTPVAIHFFCCVCGCPAGHDCFTCVNMGHPVCTLCKEELQIEGCPYLVVEEEQRHICGFKLNQLKSTFREFMFKNTLVGCIYRARGCNFQGPWETVKQHQQVCQYAGTLVALD